MVQYLKLDPCTRRSSPMCGCGRTGQVTRAGAIPGSTWWPRSRTPTATARSSASSTSRTTTSRSPTSTPSSPRPGSPRSRTGQTQTPMRPFAVCSDTKVDKRVESEDITTHDLAYPATTDSATLIEQANRTDAATPLTAIFSTYQSISTVAAAQQAGFPRFDLVICDEAHRTTGVTLVGEECRSCGEGSVTRLSCRNASRPETSPDTWLTACPARAMRAQCRSTCCRCSSQVAPISAASHGHRAISFRCSASGQKTDSAATEYWYASSAPTGVQLASFIVAATTGTPERPPTTRCG